MRATVKKWGNSAAIRIPAVVMDAAKLKLDSVVEIREEAGNVVIMPLDDQEYDLERLVAGITDENIHPAFDLGAPVGKEAL
jgi:antitoxin MazE